MWDKCSKRAKSGMIGRLGESDRVMVTVHSINWIVSDPAIRNGRPVIAETTIRVMDIAAVKIFQQKDADDLAAWFGISLPQVYAALAYYYEHKDVVDAEMKAEAEIAREFKEKRIGSRHPSLVGLSRG